MGVWGSGSFDNDDALDWVEHLVAANLDAIETALRKAIEGRSIDAPVAARAIAAAETVATLLGQPGSGVPEAVVRWIDDANLAAPPTLAERATSALRLIVADEGLTDTWRTSGLLAEWRANIDNLLGRLDLAPGAATPEPAPSAASNKTGAAANHSYQPVLAHRVQSFLANIAPFEGYAPGSVAEGCLHLFAAGGPWDEDARSELRICYSALMDEIESGDFTAFSDRRRRYLSECAALLREIMLEVLGDARRIDLG
ncbi:MAG: DUF4259 domain-containing protein [Hyphomonadaceae bacterium]